MAVARREHEIEVAVGVDVGRPHAGGGSAKKRRGQLRQGCHVGETAGVVLSQQTQPARAGERQIHAEIVVEIGSGHGVGRREIAVSGAASVARQPTSPGAPGR